MRTRDTCVSRGQSLLIISKINKLDNSRLGLAISKKAGNAVVRNTIKRVSREFFRKKEFSINKDYLIINKKTINFKKYTTEEIKKSIKSDLERSFR